MTVILEVLIKNWPAILQISLSLIAGWHTHRIVAARKFDAQKTAEVTANAIATSSTEVVNKLIGKS